MSQRMIILTKQLVDAKSMSLCWIIQELLETVGIIHNWSYLFYSMLQPNLDPENSHVSFRTKVLFTYRQVTKSNCINLTGFGLRQNVQVLRTTQSLLWYQRTAVLLTYYHVINVPYKLLTSRRLHCYSRRSQWNSIPRSSTTIIWSLESLLRRKEQSKWEETV